MFTPILIDATDSDEFKSILNEIKVMKQLSSKSDYVINYLDSFSTELGSHIIYYIVTSLYEVNYTNFILYNKKTEIIILNLIIL